MRREKPSEEKARMCSVMRRAIAEIEAGYEPRFLLIIYPPAGDNQGIETLLGFTNDAREVQLFHKIMDEAQNELRKHFILDHLGLEEAELDAAAKQFARDVDIARERATDRLKKDAPITDTSVANELLAKLRAGEADHDS